MEPFRLKRKQDFGFASRQFPTRPRGTKETLDLLSRDGPFPPRPDPTLDYYSNPLRSNTKE